MSTAIGVSETKLTSLNYEEIQDGYNMARSGEKFTRCKLRGPAFLFLIFLFGFQTGLCEVHMKADRQCSLTMSGCGVSM